MTCTIDITEAGATRAVAGETKAVSTSAIQSAIDRVAAAGGGRVVVPPGVFVTGTLRLRSHVDLHVAAGAVLRGSHDLADYPDTASIDDGDRTPRHLLLLAGCEGASITGGGIIDGSGPAFWLPRSDPTTWAVAVNHRRPSPMVQCHDCADLLIDSVTIANSPGWTLHLSRCRRVTVRNVKIDNDLFGPNTDGIDVNGSTDVLIESCTIVCGDDGIVLKSSADTGPTRRVAVVNCSVRSNCVALKLGTEGYHDMSEIAFSNNAVHGSHRAIGLYCLDGGTYRNIVFSGTVFDDGCPLPLQRPVHIDVRRRTPASRPGCVRDVVIASLAGSTRGRILLTAEPGCTLDAITLRDVHLSYSGIEDPEAEAPRSRSTQFSNASPAARGAGAAIVAENVSRLSILNAVTTWPVEAATPMHLLWARACRGLVLDAPHGDASRPGVARVDADAPARGEV